MTQLGNQLADDLSVALAKAAPQLKVMDRSRIEDDARKNLYAPQIVVDPESLLVFARDLDAETLIVGKISEEPNKQLSVDLKAYRVDNAKGIHGVTVSFAPDDEMARMVAANLPGSVSLADLSKYPQSSASGYSPPRCVYCPHADYSREAKEGRIEGTVELAAVVNKDGRIENVVVLKTLPAGLTAEAIKAVERWKLQPATGPDGEPADVRQVIEVTFQLF
ncbi:MAG TPA: energy transducer TonB [Candidatus Aquilonibacter sp.]|nr:energy transducer TonB [Candidatus Aquilonibacter sp.]